ncbi:uncharacterized protein LOC113510330 [Galleria mellonella]|uniref:Uncharacterized protein LOC113510330 n=1 Tax=Galleria mellonella TaxID=7137 RepID=A0A6J1W9C6_GALME|nr:uncharacterized protein LOC113510330 [Galleria mellonella]
MAVPVLRQPKLKQEKSKIVMDIPNVIITLKDKTRLVVSSDAYHGILMASNMYKCVFCRTDMDLDMVYKEQHKNTNTHKENLKNYPHIDGYDENLVRKLNKDMWYCTICQITVATSCLSRHINTSSHCEELRKAIVKATAYHKIHSTHLVEVPT